MVDIIYNTDCLQGLRKLPDDSINCCVTSPPYYRLRDYGDDRQIGLEDTPEEYIARLVEVFREVKRVLTDDGTLWLNMGDCYAGSGKGAANYPENALKYKQGTNKGMLGASAPAARVKTNCKRKDLIGIPWMLAFALRADGWYLRSDIIWHKPNAMPESVKDRPTRCHEYIFLLSKQEKYYYDNAAIEEPVSFDGRKDTLHKGSGKYRGVAVVPGARPQTFSLAGQVHERWRMKNGIHIRSRRDVWTVSIMPYRGAHFATFPPALITDCIKAGCPEGGIVVDPFMGSGTTAMVAGCLNRHYIGFEINAEYVALANKRISDRLGIFSPNSKKF